MRAPTTMFLILLAACALSSNDVDGPSTSVSNSESPSTTVPAGPWIEVGHGEAEHIPLTEGQDLALVHGQQGGWHADVSGIVHGTSPLVELSHSLELALDGSLLSGNGAFPVYEQLAMYDAVARSGRFVGKRSILDFQDRVTLEDVCPLDGELGLVCVDIADLADPDEVGRSCMGVVIRMDAMDIEDCAGMGQ